MVVVKVHVPAPSTLLFTASRTALAVSLSFCAIRLGSRSATHSSLGISLASSGASSNTNASCQRQ